MKRVKPIHVFFVLVLLIASGIWTYASLQSSTLVISYIVDAVILVLLIFILIGKGVKEKPPIKHDDYKNWITEGSVDKNNRLIINIFTLDDLVKMAIDSDKRVIHDPKLGKYYVFSEDVAYVYDPAYVNLIKDSRQQIGKILLEKGIIRSEQLETGLYYQKRVGSRLGDSLVALGFIDETTLSSTLAAQQKIAYYELDMTKELTDTSWISVMSVSKARALQVLPLGRREDGKLVIACGETALSGISVALQEMFGPEIYIVAARPCHIFELLERLETKLEDAKQKSGYAEFLKEHKLEPYERLSESELEHLTKAYLKGKLETSLFIKATGFVNSNTLSQAPDQEAIISYLTSKNLISGEITNLVTALNRIIKKQDSKTRQNKVIPSLLEILKEAYYITPEAADWINNEVAVQKRPLKELLCNNYLVSLPSIENAEIMLDTLKKLVNKAKIY